MSYRITVKEDNQNAVAIPTVGNVGATVIRSAKGPLIPVKIAKGGEQRILNLFGTSYPDIQEAIEYSKKADLWISAPSKNGKYGGVLVTKSGTINYLDGFSTSTVDFEAVPMAETLGTGDGSTTTFMMTLTAATTYVNQSIGIRVNGVSIDISATDASTEALTSSPDVGTGTYVRATGVLTFTFDSAVTTGEVITAYYNSDRSADTYFSLINRSPATDNMATKITNTAGVFTVNLYTKSGTTYTALNNSPYSASISSTAKDGFGQNIYVENVFLDSDYVIAQVNTAITTFDTFVDDTSNVDFDGGDRGDAITITELTLGWAYFQQANTYTADIFFDCTADSGIPAIFETLRGTYQKYKAYMCPLPNTNSTTAITNRQSLATSNRGIYFYWNYALVNDTYNNSYMWTSLMGRIAGKHADMVDIYNGLAPSWIDENNHGGQLGSGIVKMAFDPSEGELKLLDDAQINPVIKDRTYGFMIVGDRTSYTTLSDYSYIGHSRVADYCISNIITQALPYQLTKLNDNYHRAIVKSKADAIINPLLPVSLLRQAGSKCDSQNNDDAVLAARRFVIQVAVKFTPFSETIDFIFTNTAQGTDVQELLNGQAV